MNPHEEQQLLTTRRAFLGQSTVSLGATALATLLSEESRGETPKQASAAATGGLPDLPHVVPKAKRVIYLMMSGAPSQVDLFDYKPELAKRRGEELPESVHMGQRLTTMTSGQAKKPVLPSIAPFKQHGKSGG